MDKIENIKEGYLRITDVLTPFTGIEFADKEILSAAAERGTLVHKCIQGQIEGLGSTIVPEGIDGYLESFNRFWSDSKHAWLDGRITTEKRFYCDRYQITGQLDFMAETDNCTYLIDWKTSSQEQKSWRLQGAVYKYLCESNGINKPSSVLFVRLHKDGKKSTCYRYEKTHFEDLRIFMDCLNLYKYFNMEKTRGNLR